MQKSRNIRYAAEWLTLTQRQTVAFCVFGKSKTLTREDTDNTDLHGSEHWSELEGLERCCRSRSQAEAMNPMPFEVKMPECTPIWDGLEWDGVSTLES